ncbi:hypothetical protein HBH89_251120 [Parastagonospora nodorum]|nr:hypothetical protein HBH89_251120 [Parastagonospora nodorum]
MTPWYRKSALTTYRSDNQDKHTDRQPTCLPGKGKSDLSTAQTPAASQKFESKSRKKQKAKAKRNDQKQSPQLSQTA